MKMEPPSKRLRMSSPESPPPIHEGPRVVEATPTPRWDMHIPQLEQHSGAPTRTINPSEFQRHAMYSEQSAQNPVFRRDAGIYLLPRAPEATVTANQVVVNVKDGNSTSVATTLPAVTAETIVTISDKGAVTVPAPASTTTSESHGSITSTSATITSSSSTGSLSGTTISAPANGTSTITSERTVTVTSTSTLEVSYINGTLIPNTQDTTETSTETGSFGSVSTTESSTTATAFGLGGSDDAVSTSLPVPGAGGPSFMPSTTSSDTAATTSAAVGGDAGPGLSPQQQQVLGGVVGGVAGVAVVLLVLLVVLKWYRNRLKARGELPEQKAQRDIMGGPFDNSASERSSATPLTAVLTTNLWKWRPASNRSQEPPIIPEGERGFQKIAGRKIAPILSTGGDEYGGSYGAFEKDAPTAARNAQNESSLAGSSFYRDGQGFYGGKGPSHPIYPPSPTLSSVGGDTGPRASVHDLSQQHNSSPHSIPSNKADGQAAWRPSPARTPVTISPSPSSIRLPIQQSPSMDDAPPMPPMASGLIRPHGDGIGRSLGHMDGSYASTRSRLSARSRFAENV